MVGGDWATNNGRGRNEVRDKSGGGEPKVSSPPTVLLGQAVF